MSPVSDKPKPDPDEPSGRAALVLYQASLPAMPLGFVLWLVGMARDSYVLGVAGLLLGIVAAFIWQDDQHPAHPGN